MSMKTLREKQRAERLAAFAAWLREGGSVRQAAKLAGMDRSEFRRQWKRGSKDPILTAPAPPATN